MIISRQDNTLLIKNGKETIKLNDSIHLGDFDVPGAGEYDVEGVSAIVLPAEVRTAVLGLEGVQVLYLDKPYKIDKDDENFTNIDIAAIRVNSEEELKLAEQVSKDLEPSALVLFGSLSLEKFSKELSLSSDPVDKWNVSSASLPDEGTDIVVLE